MRIFICVAMMLFSSFCHSVENYRHESPGDILRRMIEIGEMRGVPTDGYFRKVFGVSAKCGVDQFFEKGRLPVNEGVCRIKLAGVEYRVEWSSVVGYQDYYVSVRGLQVDVEYLRGRDVPIKNMYAVLQGWAAVLDEHQQTMYRTDCGTVETNSPSRLIGRGRIVVNIRSKQRGNSCAASLDRFGVRYFSE